MLSQGKRLRLKTGTIAVAPDDQGKQVAVIVPAGSVVVVIKNVDQGDQVVLVKWREATCQMFSADLRERGEVAKDAAA